MVIFFSIAMLVYQRELEHPWIQSDLIFRFFTSPICWLRCEVQELQTQLRRTEALREPGAPRNQQDIVLWF